jgi:hypothetical protein
MIDIAKLDAALVGDDIYPTVLADMKKATDPTTPAYANLQAIGNLRLQYLLTQATIAA